MQNGNGQEAGANAQQDDESSQKNWTEVEKHDIGKFLSKCCHCDEYFQCNEHKPLCEKCSGNNYASS